MLPELPTHLPMVLSNNLAQAELGWMGTSGNNSCSIQCTEMNGAALCLLGAPAAVLIPSAHNCRQMLG